MHEGIHKLIRASDSGSPNFPPTLVYNEGWMLRLILDWFSRAGTVEHPLAFQPEARWFSEALLPTPFRARRRGDARAEARTHADGLVGHFALASGAKADARLLPAANQLLVLEAKIFSPLSGGTRNAPSFNQAARSVACMAEMHGRAGLAPRTMTSLGFFVLAPETIVATGAFASALDKGTIRLAVARRAEAFGSELTDWFEASFVPAMDRMRIEALAWEDLIRHIASVDPASASELETFYELCLRHGERGSISLHA